MTRAVLLLLSVALSFSQEKAQDLCYAEPGPDGVIRGCGFVFHATGEGEGDTDPFRISTSNTLVGFSVADDRTGRLVSLPAEYLQKVVRITEQGTVLSARQVKRVDDAPAVLGILIDTSSSQKQVLHAQLEAARKFIERFVKPADQVVVYTFGAEVRLRQEFTNSKAALLRSLDNLRTEISIRTPLPRMASDCANIGQDRRLATEDTKLFDAISEAVSTIQERSVPIPARGLVVFSDGIDFSSRGTAIQAAVEAQLSNTMIFGFRFFDDVFYQCECFQKPYQRYPVFQGVTQDTGGDVYENVSPTVLETGIKNIELKLRTAYWLAYSPPPEADGNPRRIIELDLADERVRMVNARHMRAVDVLREAEVRLKAAPQVQISTTATTQAATVEGTAGQANRATESVSAVSSERLAQSDVYSQNVITFRGIPQQRGRKLAHAEWPASLIEDAYAQRDANAGTLFITELPNGTIRLGFFPKTFESGRIFFSDVTDVKSMKIEKVTQFRDSLSIVARVMSHPNLQPPVVYPDRKLSFYILDGHPSEVSEEISEAKKLAQVRSSARAQRRVAGGR